MSNEGPVDKRPPARPKEPLPPQKSEFEESFKRVQDEREATRGKRGLGSGAIFSVLVVVGFSFMFGAIDVTEIRQNIYTGDLKVFTLATCSFTDANPLCREVEGLRWSWLFISLGLLAAAALSFFRYATFLKEPPKPEVA